MSAFPSELTKRLRACYGDALAGEIEAGCAARRPVTLRVNRLRSGMEEVQAALEAAGLAFSPVPWYADALVLPDAEEAAVEALPVYTEGKIYLQSLSAMVPPLLMELEANFSVLDMAAAPGGKTTQMASLSGDSVFLTACERDAARAERLRFNLKRQGVRHCQVLTQDARRLDDAFRFDSVLLDAPCTGSGTILLTEPPRRMESAWVRKITQTQAALMKKALTVTRRGGRLVYATCSILPEENDAIVQTAVSLGARVEPVPAALAEQLPSLPVSVPGTLCIRPTALYEGFFVACLRKP